MVEGVADFVEVLRQSLMQLCQRPCCQAFRIHGLGDLPNIASDLGVPPQIVDELGVGGSEQPLANRPKSCLGWRPGLLHAFIPRQQCFEVRALKLPSSVDHQDLRKPTKSSHALPQGHHAGSVTRCIECQVKSQGPPRECVCGNRHPWPTENLTGTSDRLDVQFGVVNMDNLKGAITVPRCLLVQLPIKRLQLVAGPPTLTL